MKFTAVVDLQINEYNDDGPELNEFKTKIHIVNA
jgi:hypothetical protein